SSSSPAPVDGKRGGSTSPAPSGGSDRSDAPPTAGGNGSSTRNADGGEGARPAGQEREGGKKMTAKTKNTVEDILAKESGEGGSGDPLEESGYTTNQAGTPTRDSQSPWHREDGEKQAEVVEAASAGRGDKDRARSKERGWDWESTSDRLPGRTSSQGGSRWNEHEKGHLQGRPSSR
ncbi:unnamed protein product, partial [Ectocarpus fasciculatus]